VRRTKGGKPEGYNEICNNNSSEAKGEVSVSVSEGATREGNTEPGVKVPKKAGTILCVQDREVGMR
jgi:hypothetical protein